MPVDAAGGLTELGQALLEHHLTATELPVVVRVGDVRGELAIGPAQRCDFARRRSLPQAEALCRVPGAAVSAYQNGTLSLDLAVAPGTFTAP